MNALAGVGLDRDPDSNQTSITVHPVTPGYLTVEHINPRAKHGGSDVVFSFTTRSHGSNASVEWPHVMSTDERHCADYKSAPPPRGCPDWNLHIIATTATLLLVLAPRIFSHICPPQQQCRPSSNIDERRWSLRKRMRCSIETRESRQVEVSTWAPNPLL